MRYLFFALCISYALSSCDDLVETDIIAIEEEVYIQGFISPESDSLIVNISRTVTALNLIRSFEDATEDLARFVIRDAQVSISNLAGESVQLTFIEEKFYYGQNTNSFTIQEGEDYFLEVLVDDKIYTASCSIPLNNIDLINTRVIRQQQDDFGFYSYLLDLGFTDISNQENYYVLEGFFQLQEEDNSFNNEIFFDLEAFKTDNIGDGNTISAALDVFPFTDFESETGELEEQDLVIQLINAEEQLFQLLRARYLNSINENDPFLELAIEPNNIEGEGGVGLFAGYRYFEHREPLVVE